MPDFLVVRRNRNLKVQCVSTYLVTARDHEEALNMYNASVPLQYTVDARGQTLVDPTYEERVIQLPESASTTQ